MRWSSVVSPSDEEAEAYIQQHVERLPEWLARIIRRVRRPDAIWLRFLVAILLICGGMLWFLPIVGLWMLPLGIVLALEAFPGPRRWLARMGMRFERWRERRNGVSKHFQDGTD
jgi:hypothetical protein